MTGKNNTVFPNTIYWGKNSVFFSLMLYQLCCFLGSIIFGLSWVLPPSGWHVYHTVLTLQLSNTYQHMGGQAHHLFLPNSLNYSLAFSSMWLSTGHAPWKTLVLLPTNLRRIILFLLLRHPIQKYLVIFFRFTCPLRLIITIQAW